MSEKISLDSSEILNLLQLILYSVTPSVIFTINC